MRGLHSKVSASWLLFAKGDEVYMAARGVAGDMKLSLHASGARRMAFTSQSKLRSPESGERLIREWEPANEFAPGWKVGAAVVVPYSSIQRPLKGYTTNDDEVIWLPAPEEGQRVVLYVLLSSADRDAIELTSDHIILASHELDSGEKLWLTAIYAPLPPEQAQQFEEILDVKVETDGPSGVLGAHIFAVSGVEYPTLIDLGLGEENIIQKSKPD